MQRWRSFPRSSTLTSALNPHPPGIWKKGTVPGSWTGGETSKKLRIDLRLINLIQDFFMGDVSFDLRSPISYLGVWNPSWLIGVSGPGKSWFTIKIINLTLMNISLEVWIWWSSCREKILRLSKRHPMWLTPLKPAISVADVEGDLTQSHWNLVAPSFFFIAHMLHAQ
jgi:hypothetical protein